jgi:hypothetical protein
MKKILLLAIVGALAAMVLGCSAQFQIEKTDSYQLSPAQDKGKVSFQWPSTDGTAEIQVRRFRKGSGVVRLTVVPQIAQGKRPLTCVGNIKFLVPEPVDGVVLGYSKLSGFCARRVGLMDDSSLKWWNFALVWKQREVSNAESEFGVALIREGETSAFKEFFPAP